MNSVKARSREYFKTEYPELWETLSHEYGFDDRKEALCRSILDHSRSETLILDGCCGNGYPFAYRLSRERRLICMDISIEALKSCRRLVGNYGGTAHPVAAAVEELPFGRDRFDLLYCLRASWFFTNLPRGLSELFRVLRPGGFMLMDFANGLNPAEVLEYARSRLQRRDPPYRPACWPSLSRFFHSHGMGWDVISPRSFHGMGKIFSRSFTVLAKKSGT